MKGRSKERRMDSKRGADISLYKKYEKSRSKLLERKKGENISDNPEKKRENRDTWMKR